MKISNWILNFIGGSFCIYFLSIGIAVLMLNIIYPLENVNYIIMKNIDWFAWISCAFSFGITTYFEKK